MLGCAGGEFLMFCDIFSSLSTSARTGRGELGLNATRKSVTNPVRGNIDCWDYLHHHTNQRILTGFSGRIWFWSNTTVLFLTPSSCCSCNANEPGDCPHGKIGNGQAGGAADQQMWTYEERVEETGHLTYYLIVTLPHTRQPTIISIHWPVAGSVIP